MSIRVDKTCIVKFALLTPSSDEAANSRMGRRKLQEGRHQEGNDPAGGQIVMGGRLSFDSCRYGTVRVPLPLLVRWVLPIAMRFAACRRGIRRAADDRQVRYGTGTACCSSSA